MHTHLQSDPAFQHLPNCFSVFSFSKAKEVTYERVCLRVLFSLVVSIAQIEASCLFGCLYYLGTVVPWDCKMKGWDGNEEGVVDDRQMSGWRL